jgi:hypothetical protein
MIRKIGLLSLLVVATLFIRDVSATLTEILPASSHYEGRAYYSVPMGGGGIAGRIDFAVYDTVTNPDEFVGADGFVNPGGNRYIYAYQIFCDDTSTNPLEYFAILGIGDSAIDSLNAIDSQDDLSGTSIQPDIEYFNPSFSRAVWEFDSGLLIADVHSYFLVISSDHDWTAGTYAVMQTEDGETVVPNPEPGTLALLGIGGVLQFARRRKFFRRRTACRND